MEKVLWIFNNHELKHDIEEKVSSYGLKVTFYNENDVKLNLKGERLTEWSVVVLDICLKGINLNKYRKRLKDSNIPIIEYKSNDGIKSAIKDLSETVEASPTHKINDLYEVIFDIIQEYWCDDAEGTLRILDSILIKMHADDPDRETELYKEYPQLRKVLHSFFQVCLSFGLLPDYCKTENLTQCACTLAGKPKLIYDKDEKNNRQILLPRRLCEAVWSIIQAGNDESHTNGYDFSWMLLHSYTLKLCELISWIGKYVNENPNKEQNAKFYEIGNNEEPQTIEKDENGFFYCGETQLPKRVKEKYQAREKITMKEVIMNADLNTRYPFYCQQYE